MFLAIYSVHKKALILLFISTSNISFRVSTDAGFRIKIYFFLCDLPESLFCQQLFLNIVDDEYNGNSESTNQNRICGKCPETIVTLSNSISINLQSDSPPETDIFPRFALRLEKTQGNF